MSNCQPRWHRLVWVAVELHTARTRTQHVELCLSRAWEMVTLASTGIMYSSVSWNRSHLGASVSFSLRTMCSSRHRLSGVIWFIQLRGQAHRKRALRGQSRQATSVNLVHRYRRESIFRVGSLEFHKHAGYIASKRTIKRTISLTRLTALVNASIAPLSAVHCPNDRRARAFETLGRHCEGVSRFRWNHNLALHIYCASAKLDNQAICGRVWAHCTPAGTHCPVFSRT